MSAGGTRSHAGPPPQTMNQHQEDASTAMTGEALAAAEVPARPVHRQIAVARDQAEVFGEVDDRSAVRQPSRPPSVGPCLTAFQRHIDDLLRRVGGMRLHEPLGAGDAEVSLDSDGSRTDRQHVLPLDDAKMFSTWLSGDTAISQNGPFPPPLTRWSSRTRVQLSPPLDESSSCGELKSPLSRIRVAGWFVAIASRLLGVTTDM
jgi:hypothetical protein